jgi:hypothetical protein
MHPCFPQPGFGQTPGAADKTGPSAANAPGDTKQAEEDPPAYSERREQDDDSMDMEAHSPSTVASTDTQTDRSDDDWMMINDQSEVRSPSQGVSAIDQAMEQLASMGFHDDGGWLRSLVQSKDGDINKVLDAIKIPDKATKSA